MPGGLHERWEVRRAELLGDALGTGGRGRRPVLCDEGEHAARRGGPSRYECGSGVCGARLSRALR